MQATTQHCLSMVGSEAFPGDVCKQAFPDCGGRDRLGSPPSLTSAAWSIFLLNSRSWTPGMSDPLDSSTLRACLSPQNLRDKSPEGHDHHQSNDSSLQEALTDAGLVWDHW